VSRVVVAGGGPAGLAVAARLARLRHAVTVLDADGPGPDAPMQLRLPAALRDLFLKTGKAVETVLELTPAAVLARHELPDGTVLELPNEGERAVAAEFQTALGRSAGEDWLRLMAHARGLWEVVRGPFVEQPPMSHRGWYRRNLAVTRRVVSGRSLHGLGGRFLHDPAQRAVLDSYATRHGADPRHARPALVLVPWVEQAFRVWDVDGGVAALRQALVDRAVLRGVTFASSVELAADEGDLVVEDLSTWSGASDGVRLTPPDRNPAPGRYVVGDTAFPGSDLSLALMSAAAVADHIGRAAPIRR
jgi:phytoene dehydrogenase-like protein